MHTLGVILARRGSKSLPHKCVHPVLGRPMIEYTFDHALAAGALDAVVLSTDSPEAKQLAEGRRIRVVDRPARLADDTATVYAASQHAVRGYEQASGTTADIIVLLYGNVPVRSDTIIDRSVDHLKRTGADSVRTVAPVGKTHPDWLHRVEGDRMTPLRRNNIYRRQDLEPLYYHDAAVVAVTRAALLAVPVDGDDHFAFLGTDRRCVIQNPDDAVDVDEPADVYLAEAILRARGAAPVPAVL